MAWLVATQRSGRIVRNPVIEAAGKAFILCLIKIQLVAIYNSKGATIRQSLNTALAIHLMTCFLGYMQYLKYCVPVQASRNTPVILALLWITSLKILTSLQKI